MFVCSITYLLPAKSCCWFPWTLDPDQDDDAANQEVWKSKTTCMPQLTIVQFSRHIHINHHSNIFVSSKDFVSRYMPKNNLFTRILSGRVFTASFYFIALAENRCICLESLRLLHMFCMLPITPLSSPSTVLLSRPKNIYLFRHAHHLIIFFLSILSPDVLLIPSQIWLFPRR